MVLRYTHLSGRHIDDAMDALDAKTVNIEAPDRNAASTSPTQKVHTPPKLRLVSG